MCVCGGEGEGRGRGGEGDDDVTARSVVECIAADLVSVLNLSKFTEYLADHFFQSIDTTLEREERTEREGGREK